jgi:Zn-finger domain-containing protein
LTFFISEYRQTLRIDVPNNFSGTVYLILSNELENDFELNEFGVGYINADTYKSGFIPKVFKWDYNITDKIESYSTGSGSYKEGESIKYFAFDILEKNSSKKNISFHNLIKLNAIDTNRIKLN